LLVLVRLFVLPRWVWPVRPGRQYCPAAPCTF
jgi:hypothetical protein